MYSISQSEHKSFAVMLIFRFANLQCICHTGETKFSVSVLRAKLRNRRTLYYETIITVL